MHLKSKKIFLKSNELKYNHPYKRNPQKCVLITLLFLYE